MTNSSSQDNPPTLMTWATSNDVAAYLQCHERTVRKYQKELGGVKFGALVRFDMEKVRQVMASGGIQPVKKGTKQGGASGR